MKRLFRHTSFLFVSLLAFSVAACSQAEADPLSIQPHDRVLGRADAPVQIVEYASMTCGHCAMFHKEKFPEIQKLIEAGEVRYVFRDMPWGNLAFAAAKIARCAPADRFYNFVDAFMENQEQWAQAADPLAELKSLAALGGMDDDAFNSCLNDTELHQQMNVDRQIATDQLNVQSTPTLFINKQVITGNQPWDVFAKAIENAKK